MCLIFQSDIWALAVIVYEMATLERPFDAMLMHQLVFKIVHGGVSVYATVTNTRNFCVIRQKLAQLVFK